MSSAEQEPKREKLTGDAVLEQLQRLRAINVDIAETEAARRASDEDIRTRVAQLAIKNSGTGKRFSIRQLSGRAKAISDRRGDQSTTIDGLKAELNQAWAKVRETIHESLKPSNQPPAEITVTNLTSKPGVIWDMEAHWVDPPPKITGDFADVTRQADLHLSVKDRPSHIRPFEDLAPHTWKIRPFDEETGEPQVSIEITYPEPAENT